MKKYRIKKPVLYLGLLAIAGISVFSIYSLNNNLKNNDKPVDKQQENSNIYEYEGDVPVVSTQKFLNKPFDGENINILKNFYEVESEENIQENSIIYYESTYMQNSGIAYGGPEKFNIMSVLDGTVKSIKEDELIGTVIEIEHENGIVSIYQSVSEVKVKEKDIVKQGEIIAESGTSSVNKDLNSHLLFELMINGKIVNPENYFGKEISTIME